MIKIEDLIPLLKDGWVAMSEIGVWYWYETKPKLSKKCGFWLGRIGEFTVTRLSNSFDISPAEDWTQSLIKIERKDK